MADFVIPITNANNDGNFYFTVDLDGSIYEFRFNHNSRDGYWYYDILDNSGNYIKAGAKAVVNWPGLRLQRSRSGPPGEILFEDSRELPQDPTLNSLGREALFMYLEGATL